MNEFVTVLSAEIMRRIRSRPFMLGVVLGIFAIALMIKAPALLGGSLTHAGDSIVLARTTRADVACIPIARKRFRNRSNHHQTTAPTIAYLDAHNKAGALVVLGESNKRSFRYRSMRVI